MTKILSQPELRAFDIGTSIKWKRPPKLKAGLQRDCVRGKRRVPRPPPKMMTATRSKDIVLDSDFSLCINCEGCLSSSLKVVIIRQFYLRLMLNDVMFTDKDSKSYNNLHIKNFECFVNIFLWFTIMQQIEIFLLLKFSIHINIYF